MHASFSSVRSGEVQVQQRGVSRTTLYKGYLSDVVERYSGDFQARSLIKIRASLAAQFTAEDTNGKPPLV